ncbi:glutathione S-transferase T3-like [Eutrema salsugineum]|uniref:glutathione S-transferase T3-like n=1 Tax=Eutrema salsugineum TaxID=72664 RepID=UPI000CED0185|nr:glutathione S-transferase T3-like [Eutrema salsugineum]
MDADLSHHPNNCQVSSSFLGFTSYKRDLYKCIKARVMMSQQEPSLAEPFPYLDQVPLFSTQGSQPSNLNEMPTERRERKQWSPAEDILLISAWLNTSKDSVVGNEQRLGAFWQRVSLYYAENLHTAGSEAREAGQCKQRWHKINDLVSKFCGAYEAASREKASGINENDVLKMAHQIFFSDHKKKFTLEHAWKELRNDQKWSELTSSKADETIKKRRAEEGLPKPSARPEEVNNGEGGQTTSRPGGVKAAKANDKKNKEKELGLSQFQSMWTIKKEDNAVQERLSMHRLLENLIAKGDTLTEVEAALKQKLITDILST